MNGTEHVGTFAAAMAAWRVVNDTAELERLIAEQTAEMRRDGYRFTERAIDDPRLETRTSEPEYWLTRSRPAVLVATRPSQPAEGGYVDPDERVDWTNEARDLRAQSAWKPSLVRRGERPRVERAFRITDPSDLDEALEREQSRKVRGGKQRALQRRKIARLKRAIEARDYKPEEQRAFVPFTRPAPKPVIVPTVQSDYYGYIGTERRPSMPSTWERSDWRPAPVARNENVYRPETLRRG